MMGMARRGLWAIPFLDLVAGYPGAFILCTSLSCTLMIDASSCIYLIFNRKSFFKRAMQSKGLHYGDFSFTAELDKKKNQQLS